jgi:acyl-CoA reductase-like NAD-dependent aldehyde dehydrogenase
MNITESIVETGEVKIFRRGNWYESLDADMVPHTRHRIHLAPSLMVLDDARKAGSPGRVASEGVLQRAALLEKAMTLFTSGRVFVEGFGDQKPEDFAQLLWQALGLPNRLVSQWSSLLTEQLTLGLASVTTIQESKGNCLVSLPANTFVCLDACFLPLLAGMNLWIRPSQREPFSALRFLSCLLEVGWTPESLSFYPTTHATLASVASRMEQSIIYGGDDVQHLFADKSNITVHGPGRALAIVDDVSDRVVEQLLAKIVGNGGRFCLCLGTILLYKT